MGLFADKPKKQKKQELSIEETLDIANKLKYLYCNDHNNAHAVMTTARAYGLSNTVAAKILALISTYSEQDWLAALNKE